MRTSREIGHRVRTSAPIAVATAAAIIAGINPPPFESASLAGELAALTAALAAIVTYLAMRLFDDRDYLVAWGIAASVLVAGSVASSLYYRALTDDYVAAYQGAAVVIGSAPTQVGAAWFAEHRNKSPSELLFDAHGDVYLFWTRDSVARVLALLRIAYYGRFAVVSAALLSLLQAIALVALVGHRRAEIEVSPPEPSDDTRGSAVVVFIHGIRSSEKCWDELVGLLKDDLRIKGRFVLRRFGYDASSFKVDPRLRIPQLEEVGRALGGFLESAELRGRQITLVGHSQGGLVILSYLSDMVSAGRGLELSRIRQAILIATPLLGSKFFELVRVFLSRVIDNPQERELRVLNPNMSAIVSRVQGQIVGAREVSASHCPIPIQLFSGLTDAIVPEASARGTFPEVTPLRGDHSTVIRPLGRTDSRYIGIVEAILEPVGHPSVFEVERYDIGLTVEPRARKSYRVSYDEGPVREIECDNWARLTQTVTLSKKNRCRSHYEFSYITKQEGLIKATTSYVEEAPADIRAPYVDSGRSIISRFTPEPGKTYKCELEIYKGFDPEQRNIARRLHRPAYYQTIAVRLDLTRYLDGGHELTGVPELSIDNRYDVSASNSHVETTTLGERQGHVWEWALHDIREGVVRVTWDVQPKEEQR